MSIDSSYLGALLVLVLGYVVGSLFGFTVKGGAILLVVFLVLVLLTRVVIR